MLKLPSTEFSCVLVPLHLFLGGLPEIIGTHPLQFLAGCFWSVCVCGDALFCVPVLFIGWCAAALFFLFKHVLT